MIGSFHDAVVQRVRELAPDVPTSYGQGEAIRLVIAQRAGLGAFFPPVADALQLPEWHGPLRVVNPGWPAWRGGKGWTFTCGPSTKKRRCIGWSA